MARQHADDGADERADKAEENRPDCQNGDEFFGPDGSLSDFGAAPRSGTRWPAALSQALSKQHPNGGAA